MRKSFLLVVISLLTGIICQGQISEQQAKATAETATRVAMSYPESHLLRGHRREDLEDDLFRVKVKPRGRIAKAAYFYEVSGEGYFVLSPDEALYIDSADGHLIHLVAVSTRTGEAYLLSGFKNADFEFNRLAIDADLRIESPLDAQMLSSLYFKASANPSGERLIYGSLPLKHKVEDYFFSIYPEKKAQRLSKEWWLGFNSSKPNPSFESIASRSSVGYETTLAIISSSLNRTPVLDLWTLQISPEGRCQRKNTQTLYPPQNGKGPK